MSQLTGSCFEHQRDSKPQAITFNSWPHLVDGFRALLAAQKQAFPIEVAVKPNMSLYSEWLNENVGDDWRHFKRAETVDDEFVVEKEVFLFKTEANATLFKLRFG